MAHKQAHTLTPLVDMAARRRHRPSPSNSTPEHSPCAPHSSSSSSPAAPRSSSSGSEPRGAGAWRGSGGGACRGAASGRLAAGGGGGVHGAPCAPAAVPPDCSGGGRRPSLGPGRPAADRWGGSRGAAARGAHAVAPVALPWRDSFRRRASGDPPALSFVPCLFPAAHARKAKAHRGQEETWQRAGCRPSDALRCAECLYS